jgi:hypothetical protein
MTHSEKLQELETILEEANTKEAAQKILPLVKLRNAKRRTRVAAHANEMYELLLDCQKIKKGGIGKRITELIEKINMFEGEEL